MSTAPRQWAVPPALIRDRPVTQSIVTSASFYTVQRSDPMGTCNPRLNFDRFHRSCLQHIEKIQDHRVHYLTLTDLIYFLMRSQPLYWNEHEHSIFLPCLIKGILTSCSPHPINPPPEGAGAHLVAYQQNGHCQVHTQLVFERLGISPQPKHSRKFCPSGANHQLHRAPRTDRNRDPDLQGS